MSVVITDALARAILDSGYDAAFDAGVLEIRTGAPPGPGQTPGGTLLWSETLPADAFAAASGRSKAKNGTWEAAAVAAGTAGHYRLKATGDTEAATQNEKRQEGTITATGGSGDMTIDNTNIAVDQSVTVTSFSVAL
ncbi:MAG: hypothetical protein WEA80_01820 [Gemmatimonadaceae bacterium]